MSDDYMPERGRSASAAALYTPSGLGKCSRGGCFAHRFFLSGSIKRENLTSALACEVFALGHRNLMDLSYCSLYLQQRFRQGWAELY